MNTATIEPTLSVKEYPILFSAPMVRALLAGRKKVTRRLNKQWLKVKAGDRLWVRETHAIVGVDRPRTVRVARAERMPEGKTLCDTDGGLEIIELDDCDVDRMPYFEHHVNAERWRPSIFMPRCLCRILLECKEDAQQEQLNEITEEDAELEGVDPWYVADLEPDGEMRDGPSQKFRAGFMEAWSGLHQKPGERWEDNPAVVRLAFRRVR